MSDLLFSIILALPLCLGFLLTKIPSDTIEILDKHFQAFIKHTYGIAESYNLVVLWHLMSYFFTLFLASCTSALFGIPTMLALATGAFGAFDLFFFTQTELAAMTDSSFGFRVAASWLYFLIWGAALYPYPEKRPRRKVYSPTGTGVIPIRHSYMVIIKPSLNDKPDRPEACWAPIDAYYGENYITLEIWASDSEPNLDPELIKLAKHLRGLINTDAKETGCFRRGFYYIYDCALYSSEIFNYLMNQPMYVHTTIGCIKVIKPEV